jgi:hypothetical protein
MTAGNGRRRRKSTASLASRLVAAIPIGFGVRKPERFGSQHHGNGRSEPRKRGEAALSGVACPGTSFASTR